jgi:DNA polymerase-3 subunit epsilon
MQQTSGACAGEFAANCKGACVKKEKASSYNQRVDSALEELIAAENYMIIDKGRNNKEMSCVLIEKGSFYGMGYIPTNVAVQNTTDVKNYLTPYRNNSTIQKTIRLFKESFPEKIKPL